MKVTNAIKEQILETVRCFFTCILSPTFPWRNTPESQDGKNNIGTSQTSLYIWSLGFRYSDVFAKHATCLLQLCKNLLDLHYGTDEHAVPCHEDGKTFSDLHCLWGLSDLNLFIPVWNVILPRNISRKGDTPYASSCDPLDRMNFTSAGQPTEWDQHGQN